MISIVEKYIIDTIQTSVYNLRMKMSRENSIDRSISTDYDEDVCRRMSNLRNDPRNEQSTEKASIQYRIRIEIDAVSRHRHVTHLSNFIETSQPIEP
jgi:hypothetical protein